MENKFAVLIPTTDQVGFDTFKDSYKTLLLDKSLNIVQIMEEVYKVSKGAKLETLYFTEIIQP